MYQFVTVISTSEKGFPRGDGSEFLKVCGNPQTHDSLDVQENALVPYQLLISTSAGQGNWGGFFPPQLGLESGSINHEFCSALNAKSPS
jgi:hypothetical protein